MANQITFLPLPGKDARPKKSAEKQRKPAREESDVGLVLSEDQARSLLLLVDVIRDPLHGDIRLTALERSIVDTPEFQRLRNINQLAMTYMAYPGALHTRFLHSLGVLHVCSQMIATCNQNAENYLRLASPSHPVPLKISYYQTVLARLCALFHDLAHVPFGHTLEKEGRVFETDEWKDPARCRRLLGDDSNLSAHLRAFFRRQGFPEEAADTLVGQIKAVLTADRSAVTALPYPFIHDLVGNTICSDLIDYVQRDMFFCGLTETFGKRFLEYLAVIPVEVTRVARQNGERDDTLATFAPIRHEGDTAFSRKVKPEQFCRLVLLQYRYNERHEYVKKHDVVAEGIDLVRRRLSVAEKLYFHRTKIVASSMLVAAAHSANLKAETIWDFSDAEVLRHLADPGVTKNPQASALARKLLTRKLFKPIYRASYCEVDESHRSKVLWNPETGAYERFSRPDYRATFIGRVERLISMEKFEGQDRALGTVSVSCPGKSMQLKAFDMLVLTEPTADVARLQDSHYPPTKTEIKAIQDTHRYLWRLEIFVDPEVLSLDTADQFVRDLAGAIQHEVGLDNEITAFQGTPSVDLRELELATELKYHLKTVGLQDEIRYSDFEKLKAARFRGELAGREQIEQILRELGYQV